MPPELEQRSPNASVDATKDVHITHHAPGAAAGEGGVASAPLEHDVAKSVRDALSSFDDIGGGQNAAIIAYGPSRLVSHARVRAGAGWWAVLIAPWRIPSKCCFLGFSRLTHQLARRAPLFQSIAESGMPDWRGVRQRGLRVLDLVESLHQCMYVD